MFHTTQETNQSDTDNKAMADARLDIIKIFKKYNINNKDLEDEILLAFENEFWRVHKRINKERINYVVIENTLDEPFYVSYNISYFYDISNIMKEGLYIKIADMDTEQFTKPARFLAPYDSFEINIFRPHRLETDLIIPEYELI